MKYYFSVCGVVEDDIQFYYVEADNLETARDLFAQKFLPLIKCPMFEDIERVSSELDYITYCLGSDPIRL